MQISIDDFGTGYSSLSHLKRFPVDVLKIDQSFVHDCTSDADGAAIVQAIITMAHALGIQTIAEGVETKAQLEFLRRNGCDAMQGYYFSRPVPAEEITRHAARKAPPRILKPPTKYEFLPQRRRGRGEKLVIETPIFSASSAPLRRIII